MMTLSPRCSCVLACPSQKSVVPSFTFAATIVTQLSEEITSGRNDRLCGQIGGMHIACTGGLRFGPPADTLYAVDPLGVETITPSPKYLTSLSPSARTSNSTMWNGGPAVMTASLRAVAQKRRRFKHSSARLRSHGTSAATT